jgi:hypothetical protein
MEELSPKARGVLDELARDTTPDPARLAHGLERLQVSLGPQLHAPLGGPAGAPAVGLATKIGLSIAGVAGIVAALVLVGDPGPGPEPRVEAPVAAFEPAPAAAAAPAPAIGPAIDRPPAIAPVPAPAPGPDVEPAEVPRAAPRAAAPQSDLEEELRLIREATAASARGEHRPGLSLLAEHARRFPRGALAGERELTRAKLLCDAGDRAGARRTAARWQRRHPGSHLSPRFSEVCADPGPAPP